MIKTTVYKIKTKSDAKDYTNDVNLLLADGWVLMAETIEYHDSMWQILLEHHKDIDEDSVSGPTQLPPPEIIEGSNWVTIDASAWKAENPTDHYRPPTKDANVEIYMELDAQPIDHFQVNLPDGHTGIVRLRNLKVDCKSGRSGIKIAQQSGINHGYIQIFNCHVEGDNLVDAYHVSVRNSHVVMLDNTCHNVGSASRGHADAFQQPDGHRYLYVDGFKGTELHYQGLFLPSEDPDNSGRKWNKEGETYLKNIYLEGKSKKYLMSLYQNWNSKDVWLENVTCHRLGNIDKPVQFKNYPESGRTSDFSYKVVDNVVVFKNLTKAIHGVIRNDKQ